MAGARAREMCRARPHHRATSSSSTSTIMMNQPAFHVRQRNKSRPKNILSELFNDASKEQTDPCACGAHQPRDGTGTFNTPAPSWHALRRRHGTPRLPRPPRPSWLKRPGGGSPLFVTRPHARSPNPPTYHHARGFCSFAPHRIAVAANLPFLCRGTSVVRAGTSAMVRTPE